MSFAGVTVRRQDAPKIYEITTVAYAAKASYVMSTARLLDGQVRAVIVPEERSLDIDSELDLQFAEFLFERRGNSHRKSI
jgi:N-acylneuraminate cytidylyltransferase